MSPSALVELVAGLVLVAVGVGPLLLLGLLDYFTARGARRSRRDRGAP